MKNVCVLLLISFTNVAFAQNLSKHIWQDRILLLISNSYNQEKLKEQLNVVSVKKSALMERKLIVYQITPNSFKKGIKTSSINIKKGNNVYKKYNCAATPFTIILIGLDGGVKLESNEVLSSALIFEEIDQMPIRKQELRIKNR